jgi:hypothetical protein
MEVHMLIVAANAKVADLEAEVESLQAEISALKRERAESGAVLGATSAASIKRTKAEDEDDTLLKNECHATAPPSHGHGGPPPTVPGADIWTVVRVRFSWLLLFLASLSLTVRVKTAFAALSFKTCAAQHITWNSKAKQLTMRNFHRVRTYECDPFIKIMPINATLSAGSSPLMRRAQ